MTTNSSDKQNPQMQESSQSDTQPASDSPPKNANGDNLVDLVNTLGSVNVNAPEAEQNAISISDNQGGRITLVDDPPGSNTIKK